MIVPPVYLSFVSLPRDCASLPGVLEMNWSIDTQSPGFRSLDLIAISRAEMTTRLPRLGVWKDCLLIAQASHGSTLGHEAVLGCLIGMIAESRRSPMIGLLGRISDCNHP